MLYTFLKVTDEGIRRCKDSVNGDSGDAGFELHTFVAGESTCERDGGGPGFLVRIKRFPDQLQRLVINSTHCNSCIHCIVCTLQSK